MIYPPLSQVSRARLVGLRACAAIADCICITIIYIITTTTITTIIFSISSIIIIITITTITATRWLRQTRY